MKNYIYEKVLKYKAKRFGGVIPKNWEQILESNSQLPDEYNSTSVKYTLFYLQKTLDVSLTPWGNIVYSLEWARRLVFDNDEYVQNAFRISIGHELTHKYEDISLRIDKKDVSFMSWINEVHADFGGCQKMADGNRQKLISSIDYKKKSKDRDKDSKSHPSWQRRRYYAENFDFNEQLIRQMAEDTGCKDEKLIQQVCDYYEDIMLI